MNDVEKQFEEIQDEIVSMVSTQLSEKENTSSIILDNEIVSVSSKQFR